MEALKRPLVLSIAMLVLSPACAKSPSAEATNSPSAEATNSPSAEATNSPSAEATKTADQLAGLTHSYSADESYRSIKEWSLMDSFIAPSDYFGDYSYMNFTEFQPHSVVRRDGPIKELARRPNPTIGKTTLTDAEGNAYNFDQVVKGKNSPMRGVIVLHKGEVVYEAYPRMRRTENHVWMSNTKVVASLLIAQLEAEGKVDVNKTVGDYLPGARGSTWENIKVIDVLNQQSGLDLEESKLSVPGSGIDRLYHAELSIPNQAGKAESYYDVIYSFPKMREPGKSNDYSSANTQILGMIAEEVTNTKMADLVSQRVWMPAGMEGDGTLATTKEGVGIIHGLLSSRLIDMARFGLLYTPSWSKTASKRVVTEEMVKTIQTAGVPENFLKGFQGPALVEAFREAPVANSYQWDAVFADGDMWKGGHNGQGIYVSPERDVVVVYVATGYPTPFYIEAFVREIAKSLR